MTTVITPPLKDDAGPRYYWTRGPWRGEAYPPGEELSALRRGLGRTAGAVPEMWRFYVHLADDGHISNRLRAEHVALSLFGVHQQSQRTLVHVPGIRLGEALAELRRADKFSESAVDARVGRAATADDLDELANHLRGLVAQLKATKARQGLDYSELVRTLTRWQTPKGRDDARRRWGSDYYRPPKSNKDTPTSKRKDDNRT